MSQDVLIVSRNSEYFHLDRSYLELLGTDCFPDLQIKKNVSTYFKSNFCLINILVVYKQYRTIINYEKLHNNLTLKTNKFT